ncbi:MAG: sulfate ABC transporter permease subunit CysT [Deltaproteobacteria bacterium]|nr:MAG: sulfate ABC transporter permease subunit CysT [Deltaproteobacteria bacterium]
MRSVVAAIRKLTRRRGILPGFRLTLGFTVLYLSLVVLLPLGALVLRSMQLSWAQFAAAVSGPRALAAYKLSFLASLLGALINLVFGSLLAWVLTRYRFPGKELADALVDLPFALPTAVAGIALTAVYAEHGFIGRHLVANGIQVAFAPAGVVVALTFVGLPFVVRTVQPVLLDLDPALEEAAAVLGAGRLRILARVIAPAILPALLSGFALSFARALGEYGSVVFISGNMPLKTEIVPLLIFTRLEQYDVGGATAIAVVMLAGSFVLLFGIHAIGMVARRRPARSEVLG